MAPVSTTKVIVFIMMITVGHHHLNHHHHHSHKTVGTLCGTNKTATRTTQSSRAMCDVWTKIPCVACGRGGRNMFTRL